MLISAFQEKKLIQNLFYNIKNNLLYIYKGRVGYFEKYLFPTTLIFCITYKDIQDFFGGGIWIEG